jgi:hypothetical protein
MFIGAARFDQSISSSEIEKGYKGGQSNAWKEGTSSVL